MALYGWHTVHVEIFLIQSGLKIEVEFNLIEVNYVDVSLNLTTGEY